MSRTPWFARFSFSVCRGLSSQIRIGSHSKEGAKMNKNVDRTRRDSILSCLFAMMLGACLAVAPTVCLAQSPPNPYEMLPRSDGFLAYQIIPTPGGMRIEKDVLVTMRDGVRLASNVFRPDKPGKFPLILAMTPYGKDQTPP